MNTIKSNFIDFPYDVEQLKVAKGAISVRVNVVTGKEGEFWVCISPSINVSGYGKNIEEAKTSFNENIDTFCEDLNSLPIVQKRIILKEMGWEQRKYLKKQFSKAFVDEDGILQNLEHPKLLSLETIA